MEKYSVNPKIARNLARGALTLMKLLPWTIVCKLIHDGYIKYNTIQEQQNSILY
jgi:hypothetical protein